MSNAYSDGTQKVIPAVLLYAFSGNEVLMLNARGKDGMPGKWNGLGGKLDPGETPLQAAVREFDEEASCRTSPSQWKWSGQLYFPDFKPHKSEDWWVNVWTTRLSPEQTRCIPTGGAPGPEGTLHWIPKGELLSLNLWDGDRHFIPLILEAKPFHGTFIYEDGKCTRFDLKTIP